MKYYYDLHLHSCLSPCGSEDMTPANLAAMCALAGLDIVALTDHNTCGNCAAFCRAAEERGLLALAGMELCTREEIHVVCLFPTPHHGEEFEAYVSRRLPPLSNHPAVFGHQIYMDAGDLVLGEDPASSPDTPTSAWRRYPGWPPPLAERPFLHTSTAPPSLFWGCLACGCRSWDSRWRKYPANARRSSASARIWPGFGSSPTLTPTTWIRSGRRSTPWSCRSGRLPPFSIGCRVQGKFSLYKHS
ncbi:MAG: PHP domain-containing protein [Flavonifractor plautii]